VAALLLTALAALCGCSTTQTFVARRQLDAGLNDLAERNFAAAANYLYQDGPRFWYATQAIVTKLAEDRAEQFKRDPDKVAQKLEQRLRADLQKGGDFPRIHRLPRSSAEVPDDLEACLVVLPAEHPYSREPGNAAETAAREILAARGNAPRIY
jgi:hypothetical protein